MIRFGLCCKFTQEDISFKEIRFVHYKKLSLAERIQKLEMVILHNLDSLMKALKYCAQHNILAFRIGSFLIPLYTHPEAHYSFSDLPFKDEVYEKLKAAKDFAKAKNIRLSFHPDQFVILNSPREEVVEAAIKDLNFHAELSNYLGADVINIHAGGVYGDKTVALKRLEKNVLKLSRDVREKLTFENDDKSYTPQDLIPVCEHLEVPLVYDVHHHRCLRDSLGEMEATQKALKTWNREPLFHISSPKEGWEGPKPYRHHDYIDPADFPLFWKDIPTLTVDIEAKKQRIGCIENNARYSILVIYGCLAGFCLYDFLTVSCYTIVIKKLKKASDVSAIHHIR